MVLKGKVRSEGWFWLTLKDRFEKTLAEALLSIN